jgi:hypothetical protein
MDVVLVVDNSALMAEMQDQLVNSVPALVTALTSQASKVQDLRIGVITSSIGSHGAATCQASMIADLARAEQVDDGGHLLGTRPRAQSAGVPSGYVSWTAGTPTDGVVSHVQALIKTAGESGCGYEAPLESLYRFLADPSPPMSVAVGPCPNLPTAQCASLMGRDDELLAERAAFLRPDSSLVAVVLSNENDCSVQEGGQFYYSSRLDIVLPRGTAACAANPNDPCCFSCSTAPPSGCSADPTCPSTPDATMDKPNTRCADQKRRFGEDFLYPVERYVNAFSKPTLCTSRADADAATCPQSDVVPNPIFVAPAGSLPRSASLVHFLSIVGVPWQTIKKAGVADLQYPTGAEMAAQNLWATIYGDPKASPPVIPSDPLMRESIGPRSGTTPGTGEALAPPTAGYLANSVNGHEMANAGFDDLQYACVFQLATPRDCASLANQNPRPTCDCYAYSNLPDNPVCQNQDNTYGQFQRFSKGYPGLRHLGVVRGLGDRGALASICAKNVSDPSKPDYAYVPAVNVLARELGIAP